MCLTIQGRTRIITLQRTELPGGCGWRLTADHVERPATVVEVARAWRDDRAFGDRWNEALAAVPSRAFRWEMPGVSASSASRPFECVVLDAPGLERPADPSAFATPLAHAAAGSVVAFANLGGDALMVVPRPLGATDAFAHLASFVRRAAPAQRADLWSVVGATLLDRLDDRPVWLNTAGAGVAWLHVRLDDRPKYYHHGAYRRLPQATG